MGVEPSVVATRAEWIDESLYVRLAPDRPDPSRTTNFQIVGAEPRMWYLTGIDDAMMDVTAHAVNMRIAMIDCELIFTPGSY